jgi:hypothetical protein
MRFRPVVLVALGFMVMSSPSSWAQFRMPRRGNEPAGGFGWLASLEEGKAQAKKSGKPLMVVIRCVP